MGFLATASRGALLRFCEKLTLYKHTVTVSKGLPQKTDDTTHFFDGIIGVGDQWGRDLLPGGRDCDAQPILIVPSNLRSTLSFSVEIEKDDTVATNAGTQYRIIKRLPDIEDRFGVQAYTLAEI